MIAEISAGVSAGHSSCHTMHAPGLPNARSRAQNVHAKQGKFCRCTVLSVVVFALILQSGLGERDTHVYQTVCFTASTYKLFGFQAWPSGVCHVVLASTVGLEPACWIQEDLSHFGRHVFVTLLDLSWSVCMLFCATLSMAQSQHCWPTSASQRHLLTL